MFIVAAIHTVKFFFMNSSDNEQSPVHVNGNNVTVCQILFKFFCQVRNALLLFLFSFVDIILSIDLEIAISVKFSRVTYDVVLKISVSLHFDYCCFNRY